MKSLTLITAAALALVSCENTPESKPRPILPMSPQLLLDGTSAPSAATRATIPNLSESLNQGLLATIGNPTADKKRLFSSYNSAKAERAGGWSRGLDFSGVAWDTKRAGTLLHPRIAIVAKHYPRAKGSNITFHNRRGNPETRVIVKTATLKTTDIQVLLLDSPLRDCAIYKLLPTNYDWGQALLGSFILATDRERKLHLHTLSRSMLDHIGHHGGGVPPILYEKLISGDSGHPSFLAYGNNNLVLLGLHWTAHSDSSLISEAVQTELRNVAINLLK